MIVATIALALSLIPYRPPAPGIIRRHDRPDSIYLALGRRFPAVGQFGRIGDGALIGSRWVLTAAHVAQAAGRRGANFTIAGGRYAIAGIFLHPQWTEMGPHDIALVQLTDSVRGVRPLPLFRGDREVAEVAVIVGHGGTGVGLSRERVEDGGARGATTPVDSTDADWLYVSFDAPPGGTEAEGAPGPGDSGGPALLEAGETSFVAGVSSGGFDGWRGPGTYGAIDLFTRVSKHLAWIDGILQGAGGTPLPAAARTPG